MTKPKPAGMKAADAARASERSARLLEKKAEADRRAKELRRKRDLRAANKKFLECLRKEIRENIDYATKDGRKSAQYTLTSKRDLWGEDAYMKASGHGAQVRKVLAELRADGYTAEVAGVSTKHDESAAYMNSSGEMGSEEPYWTYDTALRVTW